MRHQVPSHNFSVLGRVDIPAAGRARKRVLQNSGIAVEEDEEEDEDGEEDDDEEEDDNPLGFRLD